MRLTWLFTIKVMSQSPFLSVALEAVQEAEDVIRKYYAADAGETLKVDGTPVTLADKAAEDIIHRKLKVNFPDHRILGEEAGGEAGDSPYLWIIDPIDGTKNYVRHIPLFATQLALLHNGEVILGVSNAPFLNELMYAEKGQGCYLNEARLQVSETAKLQDAYLSYGSIGCFAKQGRMENLLKLEDATRAHRGFGDAWSYHLLAQGKIDIMVEATTKIWDIAAATLLVAEAGGKVTDLGGEPVNEQTTSIVATNGHLHASVMEYFV